MGRFIQVGLTAAWACVAAMTTVSAAGGPPPPGAPKFVLEFNDNSVEQYIRLKPLIMIEWCVHTPLKINALPLPRSDTRVHSMLTLITTVRAQRSHSVQHVIISQSQPQPRCICAQQITQRVLADRITSRT